MRTMCFLPTRATVRSCIRSRSRTTVFPTEKFGEIYCETDHISPQYERSPRARRASKGCRLPSRAARLCGCGELHRRGREGARIDPGYDLRVGLRASLERPVALAAPSSSAHLLRWLELPGPRDRVQDGGAGRPHNLHEAAIRDHRTRQ